MPEKLDDSTRRKITRTIKKLRKRADETWESINLPDHAAILFDDPYDWSINLIKEFIAHYPSVTEFFRDATALRVAEVQLMLRHADDMHIYLKTGVMPKPKKAGTPKNPADYFPPGE